MLPIDGEHEAVDTGADAEQGDSIIFAEPALFDAEGHCDGEGGGAGVA